MFSTYMSIIVVVIRIKIDPDFSAQDSMESMWITTVMPFDNVTYRHTVLVSITQQNIPDRQQ